MSKPLIRCGCFYLWQGCQVGNDKSGHAKVILALGCESFVIEEGVLMRCSLVLGVMSEDHPGILDILSGVITAHKGEWTESKMVTMAGKFAGILTVELPCRSQQMFTDELSALVDQGIRVWVERIEAHNEPVFREFQLEMVGQDRSGIVREITHLLAEHSINLDALESRIESASMSGETLFIATAVLHIPETVDLNHLQDDFEQLANEMMVDIKLGE